MTKKGSGAAYCSYSASSSVPGHWAAYYCLLNAFPAYWAAYYMFTGNWAAYPAYSVGTELPILPNRCSLATELPTLPIQLEWSCLFCLVLAYSTYSVGTARELPILPTTCSLAGIELGTSSGRSRVSGRASSQVNLLVNLFFKVMLPLFFSGLLSYLVGMKKRTSRCFPCKRGNSHFLHYLKKIHNAFRRFFTEKKLFTERANSFLEELLPFRKRLKTREAKSCFQQDSLDHGQVNSNLLDWAIDAGFIPLWYLMVMHW